MLALGLLHYREGFSNTVQSRSFHGEIYCCVWDSDREGVAERKIQQLRQGSRSAAIYAVEFQHLTCDLDWNDKAFMTRFRYRLRDDVKNLLITMPKVDTLEELISQSIICDNRLFELR